MYVFTYRWSVYRNKINWRIQYSHNTFKPPTWFPHFGPTFFCFLTLLALSRMVPFLSDLITVRWWHSSKVRMETPLDRQTLEQLLTEWRSLKGYGFIIATLCLLSPLRKKPTFEWKGTPFWFVYGLASGSDGALIHCERLKKGCKASSICLTCHVHFSYIFHSVELF